MEIFSLLNDSWFEMEEDYAFDEHKDHSYAKHDMSTGGNIEIEMDQVETKLQKNNELTDADLDRLADANTMATTK